MQFYALLFMGFPFFVVIGGVQLVLGRFLPISLAIRILPFAAAVVLQIPAIIDTSLKNSGLQITGAILSAVTAILIVVLVVRDLLRMRRLDGPQLMAD